MWWRRAPHASQALRCYVEDVASRYYRRQVTDEEIDEVFKLVPVGTPVEIRP